MIGKGLFRVESDAAYPTPSGGACPAPEEARNPTSPGQGIRREYQKKAHNRVGFWLDWRQRHRGACVLDWYLSRKNGPSLW